MYIRAQSEKNTYRDTAAFIKWLHYVCTVAYAFPSRVLSRTRRAVLEGCSNEMRPTYRLRHPVTSL